MKKLNNIFILVVVIFLTLISFSCVSLPGFIRKSNLQADPSMGRLNIINHGGLIIPTPFNSVKYYIDGNKVASHNADTNYEAMVQVPPGKHNLIVERGDRYKCTYSFSIERGQIGTFNNFSYYTYVMKMADRVNLDWGFNNIFSQVIENKVGKNDCHDIDNDIGKEICKKYYDNLCR
jgi:hypothetical protein